MSALHPEQTAASVDVNAAVVADVNAAVAAAAGLRLVGFNAQESAGTPAATAFKIVNGATGAGGTVIAAVKLAASSSVTQWFGPEGIAADSGLSIDWVSGQVDVQLYYKTLS